MVSSVFRNVAKKIILAWTTRVQFISVFIHNVIYFL